MFAYIDQGSAFFQDQMAKSRDFSSCASYIIEQLKNIQEQTELIQKISQNKQRNDSSPTLSLQSVEDILQQSMETESKSQISVFSLGYDLRNYSFSYQDNLRFGSRSSKCLHEVKQKCSFQTYQYISEALIEKKKCDLEKKKIEKQKSVKNTLNQENIILKNKIDTLLRQKAILQKKLQKMQAERAERNSLKQIMSKKQCKLLKKEQSLIYQHKIQKKLQCNLEQQINELAKLNSAFGQSVQKMKSLANQSERVPQYLGDFLRRIQTLCESHSQSVREIKLFFQKLNEIIEKSKNI